MEIIAQENELDEVIENLIKKLQKNRIFTFVGDLGAGKTTLIKKFCSKLGVEGEMSSPTFGLVNTYSSNIGTIYHTDWYRINNVIELYDAGIDEALDNGIWLIEWPEIGKALLENYVEVNICHANTSRSYIIG